MKFNKHLRKAFTLVELIIVIAVIGILAVFMVPNFSNVLGDANAKNVANDTRNILSIVNAYITDVGAVPVANLTRTQANAIKIQKSSNEVYYPGVSTDEFRKAAEKGKYYVIDMDLLTKPQINVDNKTTKTTAKLSSIPSTSAIKNIVSAGETAVTVDYTAKMETNKKIKNNSVVYVIDKDLNVYATYSKNIKASSTDSSLIKTSAFTLLSEGEVAGKTAGYDETFKSQSYTLAAGDVLPGIMANDSNYN